jgi:hypothetical protein
MAFDGRFGAHVVSPFIRGKKESGSFPAQIIVRTSVV